MNKRQRKKSDSRYPLLKRVQRNRQKRRGLATIDYAFVPIAYDDMCALTAAGYMSEHLGTSHWLIALAYATPRLLVNETRTFTYKMNVWLCNARGSSPTEFACYVYFAEPMSLEDMQQLFTAHVAAMHDGHFCDVFL